MSFVGVGLERGGFLILSSRLAIFERKPSVCLGPYDGTRHTGTRKVSTNETTCGLPPYCSDLSPQRRTGSRRFPIFSRPPPRRDTQSNSMARRPAADSEPDHDQSSTTLHLLHAPRK